MKTALALLLVLLATPALAQTAQVRRGVPLYFEHDEQSLLITERYQICEDVIDDANCKDIPVIRLAGSLTFQFPLPVWVKNGAHLYAVRAFGEGEWLYAVRAFGEGEWSDASNPLTLVVTGKPLPPTNYRTTGPTGTATTSTTTTTTTPAPATMSVPSSPTLKPPVR